MHQDIFINILSYFFYRNMVCEFDAYLLSLEQAYVAIFVLIFVFHHCYSMEMIWTFLLCALEKKKFEKSLKWRKLEVRPNDLIIIGAYKIVLDTRANCKIFISYFKSFFQTKFLTRSTIQMILNYRDRIQSFSNKNVNIKSLEYDMDLKILFSFFWIFKLSNRVKVILKLFSL